MRCSKCGDEIPEDAGYCPKCGAPVGVTELRLAFWGERFVAWLIDVIILSIIVVPLRILLSNFWPSIVWAQNVPTWIPFVDFGTSNVIHLLYWMLMEHAYGQSFGKMVMRIRVTRLDGQPISLQQAALESVGKAFLLPLDCLLGWIFYPRRRQRIFNYLSETIVIRLRRTATS
jgi:uncharacterized RDD family membrane protein YckC